MKEEGTEESFVIGEYVDFNNGTNWTPRVIVSLIDLNPPAAKCVRIKDPRYNFMATDSPPTDSPKLQPFRTHTSLKPPSTTSYLSKWKKFNADDLARRQAELEDFATHLLEKTAKQIIQFFRGRHYFFADELINSHFQDANQYKSAMHYLATHRTFFVIYLRASSDIYASPMSALCSCYPQLIDFTTYAVGTNSEFDVIRRQFSRYHNQIQFQEEIATWVERELFAAIEEGHHETFPPNLIFALFSLLHSLFSRIIMRKIPKLGEIYEILYNDLRDNINQPFNPKELNSFEMNCQSYFKLFPKPQGFESGDESSQTEQLQMIIEPSNSNYYSGSRSKVREMVEIDDLSRSKKLEFKLILAHMYRNKGDDEKFLKEINNIVCDLYSKLMQENYREEKQWPAYMIFTIDCIVAERIPEIVIAMNLPASETALQRSIVVKLYSFKPEIIIPLLVKYEKLLFLKMLLQPNNRPTIPLATITQIVDQVIKKSPDTKNHKEYLDFFNHLDHMAKGLYPFENLDNLRKKLIENSFQMGTLLNKADNRTIVDNLLDFSDPLRERIWKQFIKQKVLPHANEGYSYLYETSIQRYSLKNVIGIETFTHICEFMRDPDIKDEKYEKRKTSVIYALHQQYRHNREQYPQYLSIFLQYFCDKKHDKDDHEWSSLFPFLADEKYPPFITLPMTKQYCQEHLDLLRTLYYETDISIFVKLMLKLNMLNGKITVDKDQTILKVNQIPDYFLQLLTHLYSSINLNRLRLLEKQVEKYFVGADESSPIYNQMLVEFLRTILEHEARRPEVNVLFKKLKSRFHQIPKIVANTTPTIPPAKTEETLSCRNRKIYQKCLSISTKPEQQQKYFSPFFEDEKLKINIEICLNRMEQLKYIRNRIAYKLSREPLDVIIFIKNEPIKDENYEYSFQKVYYEQFFIEYRPKDIPLIEYEINPNTLPIKQELLNRVSELYKLLPNTISLLRGIDIMEENWNEVFSLQFMKKIFEGNLQRCEHNYEELKASTCKLDFLLDFYIWKLEDKKKYSFKPFITFLRKNDNNETVLRNYKILYLLNQSSKLELSFDDCEMLMLCLLPDHVASKDKQERTHQSIRSDRTYDLLQDIVYKLIQRGCDNSLLFMSTSYYYTDFTQYDEFYNTYNRLWAQVYLNSTIEQKKDFFKHFHQTVIDHPDNMRDFYSIITYDELTKNEQFYQQVIAQLTSLLLRQATNNITINEMKTIEILIINISEISDQFKIFHPILQSRELVEFIKSNIYLFSEKTQTDLLNIIKIIVANNENRANLIQFFEKETREKEWASKNVLIKQLGKQFQLQERIGLRNPHSICYVNSFLQQLYHIQIFRDELLQTQYTQHRLQEEDLIYQLKKIFLNLHYGRQPYINHDFFKAFKNIEGGETSVEIQMDVDQFRNLLLDRIQNLIPTNNNFVKKIFNGKQRSIIKSHDCEHQSKKEEQFSSLCIEVKGFTNLEESLNSYFKSEILKGDNAYHCDECQKKVTAEKHIQIQQLPPYLTFVLKRFEYVSYTRSKINTYFEFPLGDFEYFAGKKYRLKGVIVHMGISEAGHYISFAKHNNIWYEFNDCIVDEVDELKLKQCCFGAHPRYGGHTNPTKNAYVIIYQIDNPPQKTANIEKTFYGIADEHKKIVKNQMLSSKERVYFSANFLETLNYITQRFNEPSSIHLLFWTLMSIHLRIKNDFLKHEILIKSLRLLKQNKKQLKFVWQENQLQRVIQVFTSQLAPEYKSIFIQILVENCEQYNVNVQNLLKLSLKKIYHEKLDNTGYYMLMHGMARKFDEACQYMNSQRIVGRILDILLIGIIGDKIRMNLKNSCDLEFELIPFSSKSYKDPSKPYFKYHKWGLVVAILERTNFNLHEVEKQYYVFQVNNLIFGAIFAQAVDKPTTKLISKYFAMVCKENVEYSSKLFTFIGDQFRDKDDVRKYMKCLKEVFFISDNHTYERNRAGAIILYRYLKKLYDQRRDHPFFYAWQWFLSISRTNFHFRKVIKQFNHMFEVFSTVAPQYFTMSRHRLFDNSFKVSPTKNPLYGIIVPTSLRQTETLIQQKNVEMVSILRNENDFHDPNDYDGDIIYRIFQHDQAILRFDENKFKFTKALVHFYFGDMLILKLLDKFDVVKEGATFCISYRGDERLRLRTEALPDILILDDVEIESDEHNSPRQI